MLRQFILHDPDATSVSVFGEWDNWSGSVMHKNSSDDWKVTIDIPGGKIYSYKYVVDGEWIFDPDGATFKRTQGVDNSLLVMQAGGAADPLIIHASVTITPPVKPLNGQLLVLLNDTLSTVVFDYFDGGLATTVPAGHCAVRLGYGGLGDSLLICRNDTF